MSFRGNKKNKENQLLIKSAERNKMSDMSDKERLITEWKEHGKIILAVDYDDTIFPHKHNTKKNCDDVIDIIKAAVDTGAYIMIHTASHPNRYDEIRAYCSSKGIEVDSINKNPIELPYGQLGKPFYNWQLCDRSGLQYAVEVLRGALADIYIWNKIKK